MLPTDIGHGLWGLELTDIAGNVTLHEVRIVGNMVHRLRIRDLMRVS